MEGPSSSCAWKPRTLMFSASLGWKLRVSAIDLLLSSPRPPPSVAVNTEPRL